MATNFRLSVLKTPIFHRHERFRGSSSSAALNIRCREFVRDVIDSRESGAEIPSGNSVFNPTTQQYRLVHEPFEFCLPPIWNFNPPYSCTPGSIDSADLDNLTASIDTQAFPTQAADCTNQKVHGRVLTESSGRRATDDRRQTIDRRHTSDTNRRRSKHEKCLFRRKYTPRQCWQ